MTPARLVVLSLFRQRAKMVERYSKQLDSMAWNGPLDVVLVHGDSTDGTGWALDQWAESSERPVHVLHHDLGRPLTGSVVDSERFKTLSLVVNVGLEYIAKELPGADYFCFLEGDLIVGRHLMRRLRSTLDAVVEETGGPAVVAPFIWYRDRHTPIPIFYDTWAFRHDGTKHTGHFDAFTQEQSTELVDPYRVASAGTCLFCSAEPMYAGARFPPEDVIVGFCRQMTERGATIWCDPSTHVIHPPH